MQQGDVFEVNYTVTKEIYEGYIKTFDDKNPLHTDEQFAKEKGFSSVVMHGGILTGFLSNFIGEQLPMKNVIVQSYKISFMKPVYADTPVTLKAVIADIFQSVNFIVFKFSFENGATVFSKGEITISII